jgi:hypothetical protein
MPAASEPEPKTPPAAQPPRHLPRWLKCSGAGAWRFALAGPPIGTALFVVPAMLLSPTGSPVTHDEVLGGWLFFSIFAYFFAGPSAAVAGALYGWMKYRSGHRSRWGLGALAGTLGWLLQISVAALWAADAEHLQAVAFTPLALAAGALCGRLFDLDRSTAGAPPP